MVRPVDKGAHMHTQGAGTAAFPRPASGETRQDILIVASFGVWAMLLGFMPVVAWRVLMG
jgi:hypothetical protein